jgi:hypothetical protein
MARGTSVCGEAYNFINHFMFGWKFSTRYCVFLEKMKKNIY